MTHDHEEGMPAGGHREGNARARPGRTSRDGVQVKLLEVVVLVGGVAAEQRLAPTGADGGDEPVAAARDGDSGDVRPEGDAPQVGRGRPGDASRDDLAIGAVYDPAVLLRPELVVRRDVGPAVDAPELAWGARGAGGVNRLAIRAERGQLPCVRVIVIAEFRQGLPGLHVHSIGLAGYVADEHPLAVTGDVKAVGHGGRRGRVRPVELGVVRVTGEVVDVDELRVTGLVSLHRAVVVDSVGGPWLLRLPDYLSGADVDLVQSTVALAVSGTVHRDQPLLIRSEGQRVRLTALG